MSEQSINQPLEDEISLKDFIDFLSESWKAMALSGILGGLLASGYAFITPPKYEATANFQVARVMGVDVEAPATLMEKLKMPMYYSTESYSACNVMDSIEPGAVIAKSLKPVLSKTAPIISFSYKAKSREDAQNCVENVLNDINNNQNILAKSILESKKNQLRKLKQKLEAAERIIESLPNKNPNFNFSDSQFSASALLLVAILSKENEIQDIRNQIFDLEIGLVEPQTRESFLITPIYMPTQSVSPSRNLIVMGGVAAGLCLALVLGITRRAYLSYKASDNSK
jgi:uncharacterized protein involved in exopolysaccharide biosynthesis